MDEFCPGCGRKLQRGFTEGEKELPDCCYRYAGKKPVAEQGRDSDFGSAVLKPPEPQKKPLPLLPGFDE